MLWRSLLCRPSTLTFGHPYRTVHLIFSLDDWSSAPSSSMIGLMTPYLEGWFRTAFIFPRSIRRVSHGPLRRKPDNPCEGSLTILRRLPCTWHRGGITFLRRKSTTDKRAYAAKFRTDLLRKFSNRDPPCEMPPAFFPRPRPLCPSALHQIPQAEWWQTDMASAENEYM